MTYPYIAPEHMYRDSHNTRMGLLRCGFGSLTPDDVAFNSRRTVKCSWKVFEDVGAKFEQNIQRHLFDDSVDQTQTVPLALRTVCLLQPVHWQSGFGYLLGKEKESR
ncbi:hypothetical protein E1B28_010546 [Marasmius oreades]|uniref:Uncharacterized protein n=1 Tax=Marasmius oreades TaxID=181124 RepID=A0A9P7UR87_9AGAR|nr:uncharacterized protein E1B28_010546 [Marasmius oreades]KAG7091517.1 hypothetical protein E1B28_010546 [Marasmius oreades]